MGLFSRIALPSRTLVGEDLAVVIQALERSAAAMPDPTETIKSREVRAARETKLAAALRVALAL